MFQTFRDQHFYVCTCKKTLRGTTRGVFQEYSNAVCKVVAPCRRAAAVSPFHGTIEDPYPLQSVCAIKSNAPNIVIVAVQARGTRGTAPTTTSTTIKRCVQACANRRSCRSMISNKTEHCYCFSCTKSPQACQVSKCLWTKLDLICVVVNLPRHTNLFQSLLCASLALYWRTDCFSVIKLFVLTAAVLYGHLCTVGDKLQEGIALKLCNSSFAVLWSSHSPGNCDGGDEKQRPKKMQETNNFIPCKEGAISGGGSHRPTFGTDLKKKLFFLASHHWNC